MGDIDERCRRCLAIDRATDEPPADANLMAAGGRRHSETGGQNQKSSANKTTTLCWSHDLSSSHHSLGDQRLLRRVT